MAFSCEKDKPIRKARTNGLDNFNKKWNNRLLSIWNFNNYFWAEKWDKKTLIRIRISHSLSSKWKWSLLISKRVIEDKLIVILRRSIKRINKFISCNSHWNWWNKKGHMFLSHSKRSNNPLILHKCLTNFLLIQKKLRLLTSLPQTRASSRLKIARRPIAWVLRSTIAYVWAICRLKPMRNVLFARLTGLD